jgi:hypothetical protein
MDLMNFPVLFGVCSAVALWLSARAGSKMHKRSGPIPEGLREDLGLVVGAIMTLLGLLIGFSFSMAISRYDQRKNFEEEEANAIGTEYVRADLLPAANAAMVRQLLLKYLDQRILWHSTRFHSRLPAIDAETTRLQNEMWSEVKTAAAAQRDPISAVVVTGMNDVLNRQGYTQAAWWNRIPTTAWVLMVIIALFCNFLIGFSAREFKGPIIWVLPLAVAFSFTLIADVDSPRGGLIRVVPQNLVSLAQSIRPQ